MSEFVIRINGRMLERIAYWTVILVLVALLVLSYLRHCDAVPSDIIDDSEEGTPVGGDDGQDADLATPVVEPEPEPQANCSDGVKNQDETNVDCGGACTAVNGRYWYDNACHKTPEPKEPTLSNRITVTVSDVKTFEANTTGAIKVTGLKISIDNGKTTDLFPTAEIYVKTKSGLLLNQYTDDVVPYIGPLNLPKVESGETKTFTVDQGGTYLPSQTGYRAGDEFKLVVEIYDDRGNKIEAIEKLIRP